MIWSLSRTRDRKKGMDRSMWERRKMAKDMELAN